MPDLLFSPELNRLVAGQPYTLDGVGMSGSAVLLFDDKVLKIRPAEAETRTEAAVMRWLSGRLPVPRCLYHGEADGTDYLLMSRVPGRMACEPEYLAHPQQLVQTLANSLRQLWQADSSGCPVRWDLDAKLAAAAQRVEQGLVDVEDAEPETFGPGGFADPRQLLQWLQTHRPTEELVLSHGDFCLPNVFLADGQLSGLIDLGRTGLADRWQDIALCWRSLKHNYDGRYGGQTYSNFDPDCLFDALGIRPDREKLRYYLLLDELF